MVDGWTRITIGECCEILDYKRIPLNSEEREKIQGHIPYYGANGVLDHINDFIFNEDLILMAEDGGYFDEFATRPIAYKISGKSWVNNHAHILKAKKRYCQDFIFYSLAHKNVFRFIKGGTRSKLNQPELRSIEINIPTSYKEQVKIAEILMKVDEAINQTEKIITKQERIKEGLMQDLFTKGIGEEGNIRSEETHKFKDSPFGRVPEECKVLELGNKKYFELKTGGTPSTEKNEYWDNGTIDWLSSGEVHKKRIYFTDKKITQKGFDHSNATYIPTNSTLIALAGQGKTRGTAAINEIKLTTNQSVAAIVPNKKKVNPYYLFHYMDNQYWTLRSVSAGAGRAGLSLGILSQFLIILPEIKEQNKISNLLEGIDKNLQSNKSELSKLKHIKTGLMQDLLTGKVRVNHLIKQEVVA